LDFRRIILNLIPMLLSLSVHEFAHALVADRLGDDTPRRQGRLTLSPLAHYDIFGTFLIPAVATMMGGFALIGWAKPVEFNPGRMTRKLRMGQASALVAMAGPASNLGLACLSAGLLAALQHNSPDLVFGTAFGELLGAMVLVNIALFVFNLLPMPPLDGSYLLPRSLDDLKARIAPYSFLLILILLNISFIRETLFALPVRFIGGVIGSVFGVMGMGF
jgi:Zn-dependent protease